jgi:hypothetical protein
VAPDGHDGIRLSRSHAEVGRSGLAARARDGTGPSRGRGGSRRCGCDERAQGHNGREAGAVTASGSAPDGWER